MRVNTLHKPLCALLLVVLFFGTGSVRSKSVDTANILRTVPQEDRESLEWFFRHFWESSYVLFGNKPMAFCCIQTTKPYKPQISEVYTFMDSICRLHLENFVQTNGWEAWKKHKHLFPSTHFVILENSHPDESTIVLINKHAFLNKIDENIDYFKKALGSKVTSKQVYEDCLKSRDLFQDVLKNHEGLIGILLGYGRTNAELFYRKLQITNTTSSREFTISKNLIPSNGFATIDEEYKDIDSRLSFFNDLSANDFNPISLPLPGFLADNSSNETKKIKSEYTKQYKKIIQAYKNEDFLNTTINQFCNYRPDFNNSTSKIKSAFGYKTESPFSL